MKLDKSKFLPYFTPTGVVVDKIPESYPGSVYVGQFPLKHIGIDRFTDWHADVFYNPNPDTSKGHSNYFAVYVRDGKGYITDAKHVETMLLTVIEDSEGNFIYPRFQHDFRYFDGSYFCDGGWWMESTDVKGKFCMMSRIGGAVLPKRFTVEIKDGEYYRI